MKMSCCVYFWVPLVCLWFLVGMSSAATGDSMATKCATEFQKVTPCLAFATEKAATPSKDCCDSVTSLKDSNPVCLCYIIQQVHNGSNAVKSMGLQESRLLQLPSACKLANASVSECPSLLQLPSNSPDAAIFSNVSTVLPPSTTTGGMASPQTGSNGIWHEPQLVRCLTAAVAVFLVLGFHGGATAN